MIGYTFSQESVALYTFVYCYTVKQLSRLTGVCIQRSITSNITVFYYSWIQSPCSHLLKHENLNNTDGCTRGKYSAIRQSCVPSAVCVAKFTLINKHLYMGAY